MLVSRTIDLEICDSYKTKLKHPFCLLEENRRGYKPKVLYTFKY